MRVELASVSKRGKNCNDSERGDEWDSRIATRPWSLLRKSKTIKEVKSSARQNIDR